LSSKFLCGSYIDELRRFVSTSEKYDQVGGSDGVVNSVSGTVSDAHFCDAFPYTSVIAKISSLCTVDT